jgi:integrase
VRTLLRTLILVRTRLGDKPLIFLVRTAGLEPAQGFPQGILSSRYRQRSLSRDPGNGFIFPSPVTGQPSASLHFPWTRIRKRAGLTGFRLHDLRHSFASFLVNKGVSIYVVQGLLGHANVRATSRYAHLANETLSDAAELIRTVVLSTASTTLPDHIPDAA